MTNHTINKAKDNAEKIKYLDLELKELLETIDYTENSDFEKLSILQDIRSTAEIAKSETEKIINAINTLIDALALKNIYANK